MIRRAFADLAHGQIHYRETGSGRPLLLLHGSPGSSRHLQSLMQDLAGQFRVIAPDTPGNGASVPLPIAEPTIIDYARTLLEFVDKLGLEQVDIYGTHTGADTAVEFAILAPERVGKLILDGVGMFTPEQREDMLANYAPRFTPDLEGAYLARAFTFCRDMFLFYPWYQRTAEGRRPGAMVPAAVVHSLLVDVLETGETYSKPYHAAFRWDGRERLPLVPRPALFTVPQNDPLLDDTRLAFGLTPGATWADMPSSTEAGFREVRAKLFLDYLA